MIKQAVRTPGETFGELALKYDQSNPHKVYTRQATVTTKVDSVFAIIGKKDYIHCFERIEKITTENRLKFFQSIPYLKSVSWKIIR